MRGPAGSLWLEQRQAAGAAAVVAAGNDYLFALKQDQPLKLRTAIWLLRDEPVLASTEDVLTNQRSVVRTLRLVTVPPMIDAATKKPLFWATAKTVAEITAETLVDGVVTAKGVRYYLSSLDSDAMSPEHWLLAVRRHWGVENDCHKTFDVAFGEDDRLWIKEAPQGTLVVLLLRRLAYNLLTLFRSVTQRSDERRAIPWRQLMSWIEWTLLAATDEQIDALRARKKVVAAVA